MPLDRRTALAGGLGLLLTGCGEAAVQARPLPASPAARKLIAAARAQIGVTRSYDPAYTRLAYPGGDVDRSKGRLHRCADPRLS